ncbi:hypothetical protein B0H12DRAFT_1069769 [Mycena haematopus]|nr:hypothetical protein B0H12DRAFT_1069769 [Mycena haematopus]
MAKWWPLLGLRLVSARRHSCGVVLIGDLGGPTMQTRPFPAQKLLTYKSFFPGPARPPPPLADVGYSYLRSPLGNGIRCTRDDGANLSLIEDRSRTKRIKKYCKLFRHAVSVDSKPGTVSRGYETAVRPGNTVQALFVPELHPNHLDDPLESGGNSWTIIVRELRNGRGCEKTWGGNHLGLDWDRRTFEQRIMRRLARSGKECTPHRIAGAENGLEDYPESPPNPARPQTCTK